MKMTLVIDTDDPTGVDDAYAASARLHELRPPRVVANNRENSADKGPTRICKRAGQYSYYKRQRKDQKGCRT